MSGVAVASSNMDHCEDGEGCSLNPPDKTNAGVDMRSIFKTLLSGLYVMVRGRSVVSTTPTSTDVNYTYRPRSDSKMHGKTFYLSCIQYRHDVKYERWYVPNRTHYTYKVFVLRVDNDDDHTPYPVEVYPHLCMKSLAVTDFPHHLALNAYVDKIIQAGTR